MSTQDGIICLLALSQITNFMMYFTAHRSRQVKVYEALALRLDQEIAARNRDNEMYRNIIAELSK